jgi:hypothetical protein
MQGFLEPWVVQTAVGNISNGFRDSRKDGRGVFPSHGKHKGDCHQFRLVAFCGKDHGKFGSVMRGKANVVEAIGKVHLEHVYGSPPWVGQEELAKETFKGSAKLHGLHRCKRDGIRVLIIETEIANNAWASIVLGNHTKGGNAEVGELLGN